MHAVRGLTIAARDEPTLKASVPDVTEAARRCACGYGGRSCGEPLAAAVTACAAASGFSHVRDGRFQGGFITRRYGRPADHVHALQLEIAQRVYMDEASRKFNAAKAALLRDTLRRMVDSFIETATKSG